MKILSISAQKPMSTGSGVYLSELVKVYAAEGHEQAVIAGVVPEDSVEFPEGVTFYPVHYMTEALPFPVCGMSDEMPYPSTRYCDMTPAMVEQFLSAFGTVLDKAVAEFRPDVILCHHLYLLTAFVRSRYPNLTVCGFCHNTDLRQMEKHDLEKEFIQENIRRLDAVFAPQQAQADGVISVYNVDPAKLHLIGIGYNSQIFQNRHIRETLHAQPDAPIRLVFVGKISEKKGICSLLRAMNRMSLSEDRVTLELVGSAGSISEYKEILKLASECRYPVLFQGARTPNEVAGLYNRADIFVLPSFFDAIALTVVEAMACGTNVVVSELPGIHEWLDSHVHGADMRFVPLPPLKNADEPEPEGLAAFEERLADTLEDSIRNYKPHTPDVSEISWEGVANLVLRCAGK